MKTKPLPPIDRYTQTLREQVLELLRSRIMSGALPPRARLNETELAAELQVSRGPIREAIQRLASAGLVDIEPHRGAYVRSLSNDDIAGIYEIRLALETHAARLAARNASKPLRRRLERLLTKARDVIEASDEPHYPPNLDIHQAIISGCGVPRLEHELAEIHKELAIARARSGWQPRRAKVAWLEHFEIVRAVCDGDEKAAVDAMYHHLQTALFSMRGLG